MIKDIVFTTAIGTVVIMFAAIPLKGGNKKLITAFGGVASILAGYTLGLILQSAAGLL